MLAYLITPKNGSSYEIQMNTEKHKDQGNNGCVTKPTKETEVPYQNVYG